MTQEQIAILCLVKLASDKKQGLTPVILADVLGRPLDDVKADLQVLLNAGYISGLAPQGH